MKSIGHFHVAKNLLFDSTEYLCMYVCTTYVRMCILDVCVFVCMCVRVWYTFEKGTGFRLVEDGGGGGKLI